MGKVWTVKTEEGRIYELTQEQKDAHLERDPETFKPKSLQNPNSALREWFRQNQDTELALAQGDRVVLLESEGHGTAYRTDAIFLGRDAWGTHTFQSIGDDEIVSLHWERDVVDGDWFVQHDHFSE